METKKYYVLAKEDGSYYPYFSEGTLSTTPSVFETKPIKKSRMFNAKIVEIKPTHAIVDEEGSPYIYFLSKEKMEEVLPNLTLIEGNDKLIEL